MNSISTASAAARDLAARGAAFAPEIARAAAENGIEPRLLAAGAAQETGGPGSNSGRNVVGDGGHGRGLFQIDDRWHAFAKTSAAMDPQANADYAAGMLASLLRRYGGDVRSALSAYNSGSPSAAGTRTTWNDGRRLGYADSVLRHYAALTSPEPHSPKGTQPMGFSLGSIVKGVVTGLETLAETANPIAAAGAGAAAAFAPSQSASGAPAVPTFDPLLDEMSGNLNSGSAPQIYSYSQLAGIDANGNSTKTPAPDLASIIDGEGDGSSDDGIAA